MHPYKSYSILFSERVVMMKKQIRYVWLLVVISLVFAGCVRSQNPSTQGTQSDSNNQVSSDPAACLNRETGEGIYFYAGNDYYDLYPSCSWTPGPEIQLFSREYINPKTIQVTADIQADYQVYVHEQSIERSLISYKIVEEADGRRLDAMSEGMFPLYLYQSYAGMDWTELANRYQTWLNTPEYDEEEDGEQDKKKAAWKAFNNMETDYVEEYMSLTAEDLPVCYYYTIQFCIMNAQEEETLRTLHVTIGETTYDVDIGQINIRPTPSIENADQLLEFFNKRIYLTNNFPYGEGIETCMSAVYRVTETVTLTGLNFWENSLSTAQILDVIVSIGDLDTDVGTEWATSIKWDGKTPVLLEQGKYVGLVITFQDDRLKEINYHSKLYPVLELEYDGKSYQMIEEIPMLRLYGDIWLQYAMGLDGLDMESYFNDYYYKLIDTRHSQVSREPWEGGN